MPALRRILRSALVVPFLVGSHAHALPFASEVVQYTPGTNATVTHMNPLTALGPPSVDTGFGNVTPFNAPFRADQIVSIGAGGELVVRFDQPVEDDPLNPFGIDLLVFGNAFFSDPDAASGPFAEPGQIAVSQDGLDFIEITGVFADDLFPTWGFVDTSGPFESDGTMPADFTKPVDPLADWEGRSFDELRVLYDGSAGGGGVDLAPTGLSSIQYVRVWQPPGDTWSSEVDAFTDVAAIPEPSALALSILGLLSLSWTRRRAGRRSPLAARGCAP